MRLPYPWQNHDGAPHRMYLDTPPLTGSCRCTKVHLLRYQSHSNSRCTTVHFGFRGLYGHLENKN